MGRLGEGVTRRQGGKEMRRLGDCETRRVGEEVISKKL